MNWEHFSQWFKEKLLPALEGPSVIVLDQASYHSKRVEGTYRPTQKHRKAEIQDWLRNKGIPFDVSMHNLLSHSQSQTMQSDIVYMAIY